MTWDTEVEDVVVEEAEVATVPADVVVGAAGVEKVVVEDVVVTLPTITTAITATIADRVDRHRTTDTGMVVVVVAAAVVRPRSSSNSSSLKKVVAAAAAATPKYLPRLRPPRQAQHDNTF